jgi:hypothetical protein
VNVLLADFHAAAFTGPMPVNDFKLKDATAAQLNTLYPEPKWRLDQ